MALENKSTSPYQRNVFLAYLIDGARRTSEDGFPIIERFMVSDILPDEIAQWDQRCKVKIPEKTSMSFYCRDFTFTPVLNNPSKYIEALRIYQSIIGMDASPYDNMPPVVQMSQIYQNLALTYYYGRKGIPVIPNLRLGGKNAYRSLDAYPKSTLLAVGTNGFMKAKSNHSVFQKELSRSVNFLMPTGLLIYGPFPEWLRQALPASLPISIYPSFIMKRRQKI